ncbi:MAG TPA: hypothetical protein VJA21_07245 [Verrucomicrobiae bacterium]
MRTVRLAVVLLMWGWLATAAGADFKLTTGETLTGEAVLPTANDQGIQIKVGEGQYQKVAWGSFSQEDLKNFAKNAKIEPFVQPFIEVDPEAKIKRTEVDLKDPPRLAQPARRSLLAAMFSSSLGFSLLLLVYAANIYAAYEVSIFRAQPPALVCGLAAIPGLGFLATIAFLSMPTKVKPTEAAEQVPTDAPVAPPAGATGEEDLNPMHANGAVHPTALKLAASEPEKPKSATPETVVFQRGQYTFNRRFFETRFAGFFGVVRRDAEKDLLLVVKSSRGEYTSQRISRIAANDLHLQIQRGHATEEVLVPFQEIQEIRLKHKDS